MKTGLFVWDKKWNGVHPIRIVFTEKTLVHYMSFSETASWLGDGNINIGPKILGVWNDDY